MTTKTKDELIAEALASIMEVIKTTKDFVVEQAPDVIQQLLLFNTVKLWSLTLLGLLLLLAGPAFAAVMLRSAVRERDKDREAGNRCFSYRENQMDDYWQFPVGILVGLIVAPFVGLPMFFSNVFETIKITLAPKLWLLEYAAELMR